MKPTEEDTKLARDLVALVLRDQEAAWEPVALLIAAHREQHHHAGEVAEIRRTRTQSI